MSICLTCVVFSDGFFDDDETRLENFPHSVCMRFLVPR